MKEKVAANSMDEFIRTTAEDCLAHLTDEQITLLRENPDPIDHHFGLGLYIRNHYIHNKDLSDLYYIIEPDSISGQILEYMINQVKTDVESEK